MNRNTFFYLSDQRFCDRFVPGLCLRNISKLKDVFIINVRHVCQKPICFLVLLPPKCRVNLLVSILRTKLKILIFREFLSDKRVKDVRENLLPDTFRKSSEIHCLFYFINFIWEVTQVPDHVLNVVHLLVFIPQYFLFHLISWISFLSLMDLSIVYYCLYTIQVFYQVMILLKFKFLSSFWISG